MTWKIELEKAVPFSGALHFWHCRIDNEDLGVCTAMDGESPDQAVRKAKEHIVEQMRERVNEVTRAIGELWIMEVAVTPVRDDP